MNIIISHLPNCILRRKKILNKTWNVQINYLAKKKTLKNKARRMNMSLFYILRNLKVFFLCILKNLKWFGPSTCNTENLRFLSIKAINKNNQCFLRDTFREMEKRRQMSDEISAVRDLESWEPAKPIHQALIPEDPPAKK